MRAMSRLWRLWKKTWHFIWHEDSLASWIVNVVLAFLLIKYLVYPGLGLVFGTKFPIVAVISGSMEHDTSLEAWWEQHGSWYSGKDITKEQFQQFPFPEGFNRGDIMILLGKKPENIKIGNVVVFGISSKREPIIHRVVHVANTDGMYLFQTKGDHNPDSYSFEKEIPSEQIVGVAVLRVPYLGYLKIAFIQLLRSLGIPYGR